jgi:hypothetical protein
MPLDASIYSRFSQPQRTAVDYAAGFEQLGAMKDARQDNALARQFRLQEQQARQAGMERTNALQQFLQTQAGRPESEVIEALRGQGYFPEAAAQETEYLGRQKLRGEVAGQGVAQAKTRGEVQTQALTRYRQMLDFVDTPEGAQRWLQAQYNDPLLSEQMQTLGPLEQAVARIPTDPAAFAEWRGKAALGMENWMNQQAEQARAGMTPSIREFQFAQERGEVPAGMSFTEWKRENSRAGATNVQVSPGGVQLPAGVLKQQDEIIDRMATARAIQVDLAGFRERIESGRLDFGPVRNIVNQGRNLVGASNEESRNFASFRSSLEKLRNDSLRLNNGVQTEGDAQRAWAELFQSINDRELVLQRLREIEAINSRAAELQAFRLQTLRGNFGAEAIQQPQIAPLPGSGQPAPQAVPGLPSADAIAAELERRRRGGQ